MRRRSTGPILALPVLTLLLSMMSAPGVAAQSRSAKGSVLEEQYRHAVVLMSAGNLRSSLMLVDQVLAKHPGNVEFLLLQGQENEELSNHKAALAAFEKAETIAPSDPEVLFFLGAHWFDNQQWNQSIAYFEKCLKGWPANVDAHAFLSDSYRAKRNLPQALIYAQRAVALAPLSAPMAQRMGEIFCLSGSYDRGLPWLLKARHLNPGLEHLDFDIGKTYANQQDFTKAVQFLRSAAAQTPTDVEVQFCLADNLGKTLDWSGASDSFSAMLRIAPHDARGYLGLGRTLIALGKLDAGEIQLQKALEANPSLIEAHWQLSRLYLKQDRKDASAREAMIFDSLTRHGATESAGVFADSGQMKQQQRIGEQTAHLLAENKEADAMILLQSLPGVDPADKANQLLNLGVVYLSLDRYVEAERVLLKAYTANPKGVGIQSVLGVVYLASDQLEKAEKAFETELTSSANDPQSLAGMGKVRYLQQRWPEAVQLLEQSKTSAPESLLLLCDSYFRLGKTEEALVVAETLAVVEHRDSIATRPLAELLRKWQQPEAAAHVAKETNVK